MAWISLHALLDSAAANRLVAHAPELDLSTLAHRSLALAGALQLRGTRRAGLWFDDATQLAIALLACWRIGATAVLAQDNRPATRTTLANQAGGLDIWLTDNAPPSAANMDGADDARVAADDALQAADTVPVYALEPLIAAGTPLPAATLDLDDGAVVLCTSGSSGLPKQIRKSWRQLSYEIEALETLWRWSDRPACVLGSVSPQHMYGLPFRLLWPMCSGRSVARHQLVYPEALEHASLPHADFVWIASPALLKRLGGNMDKTALRAGLRQVFSSGGPLPDDVSDELERELDCRPCEIYGSSETGAVAWRQGNTPWRPLPGAAVGVDKDHALWVRSPWLEQGECFQSQDAARIVDDGFQLLGRMDRIVKIEERRIALPTIEQALATHPCIREARVDVATGEQRLTALVALTPQGVHTLRNGGRAALIKDLRAHLAHTQEALALPRRWRFVRDLPWNTQGKLPRAAFELALARPRWPDEMDIQAEGQADRATGAPAQAKDAEDRTTDDRDAALSVRRYLLDVPLDLRQFDGHFSTAPVVPGVVQIDWAMHLARRDLQSNLEFFGADALKFQRLIRPGDRIALSLQWEPARGRLQFAFRHGDQPCSSGRILTQARADNV